MHHTSEYLPQLFQSCHLLVLYLALVLPLVVAIVVLLDRGPLAAAALLPWLDCLLLLGSVVLCCVVALSLDRYHDIYAVMYS